jgi:hypothetical protein
VRAAAQRSTATLLFAGAVSTGSKAGEEQDDAVESTMNQRTTEDDCALMLLKEGEGRDLVSRCNEQ